MSYSLGALGYAVGHNSNTTSETKLAVDGRGSAARTDMTQFTASAAIDTLAGDPGTTLPQNTITRKYWNFSLDGSLFMSRIASQTRNFGRWKFDVGTGATYDSNPGIGGGIGFGSCSINNNIGPGDYNEVIRGVFEDKYNYLGAAGSQSYNIYIDLWIS